MKKSSPISAAGWISIPVTARLAKAIVRGRERHARLVEGVRDAVGEQRLHARPAGEDLDGADAARRGVAIAGRGDVAADLPHDPAEGSDAEHRQKVGQAAKNGSDM